MSGTTQATEDPAVERKARELATAAGQDPNRVLRIGGKDVPLWRTYRMMATKALSRTGKR